MFPTIISLLVAGSCMVSSFHVVSGACGSGEETASYKLVFHGEWSEAAFPKQYPIYRKNAQWSKLTGAVHNRHFTLWEEGRKATDAFGEFAEEGSVASLREFSTHSPDVYSSFGGDATPQGVGTSQATFTVHREFPLLSFAVRIVPSPDWFVGQSSLHLCRSGAWISDLTFDLYPMDAGTDQGFMFSSPDYPEPRRLPITAITSRKPSHPANSFYYPRMAHLPRIGHFTLTKLENVLPSWRWQLLLSDHGPSSEQPRKTDEKKAHHGFIKDAKAVTTPSDGFATPLDCEVTPWGGWSSCDGSCRVGLRRRFRLVLQKPKNRGQPCPDLVEVVICDQKLAAARPEKKKCAKKLISKEKKRYMKQQLRNFNTKGKRKFII